MSGYYPFNGDCVKCGPGKYKPSVNNDACSECPANTFNTASGSSALAACSTCPSFSMSPTGRFAKPTT